MPEGLFTSSIGDAIAGGVLIGIAASWLYLSIGRIAGISGIATQALRGTPWPLMFVLGLGIGGWLALLLVQQGTNTHPGVLQIPSHASELAERWPWLVAGGLIVGFGTRLGSGCTSGHGVCGIARLSGRSMVATCVFLGVGMLTATLLAGWRA